MRRFLNYSSIFLVLGLLIGCGDADTIFITSVSNNSGYEIDILISGDSIIKLPINTEIIIEDYAKQYTTHLECNLPKFVSEHKLELVPVEDGKFVIKDIHEYENWSCTGREDWSLITVGDYYTEIKNHFVLNKEDVVSEE